VVGGNGLSTMFSGTLTECICGSALEKVGSGTLRLSGVNNYSGTTTINGGVLLVDGSIATSSLTIVNAGGTLGGSGIVGSTTVNNGGTLAPGSSIGTLTVQGSLAFQSAATYLVEVSPAAADRTNVTGAATLAGGVNVVFAPGGYATRSVTILSAAGGLGGTTFAGVTDNQPNFATSLSYTASDVILNLTATLGLGGNLNQNQRNVATAINNFFNNGGALPPGFGTVFGLSGPALGNALTQLSGEHASGVQQAANLSMGMFLNTMLDPFVTGRSGGFGSAMGYAQERGPSRVEVAAREAFGADMPVKARPPAAVFAQRWTVWGSAYGGRNRTDGDAVVGSNDLTASTAGFAAGADYRVSPNTVLGLATAIGETRWNVSGLGKGNADVAQFGGYASTRWQNLYLSGAVAGAWYRASTDRTLNIAGTDRLEADFDATSIGGRVEGGYRFGMVNYGLTPYAAVQVQSLRTPGYSEFATAGSNQFALTYTSQTTTDTRSELGVWADTTHRLADGSQLLLRGRAAWVHDYNPDSRIQSAFQTLPGASFVVNGAGAPRDAALTSAVAEWRMTNGVSLIGKFDGEFASGSRTLAGTGTLRYAW
jgi:outer membrane autotransporter protein